MFRMGTDTFRVLLKACKLLKPSSNRRRSIRSITRVWEIPKSSKVCGIPGANPVRMGTSMAAMNKNILSHLIGRDGSIVYTRLGEGTRQSSCDDLPPVELRDIGVPAVRYGGGRRQGGAAFQGGSKGRA